MLFTCCVFFQIRILVRGTARQVHWVALIVDGRIVGWRVDRLYRRRPGIRAAVARTVVTRAVTRASLLVILIIVQIARKETRQTIRFSLNTIWFICVKIWFVRYRVDGWVLVFVAKRLSTDEVASRNLRKSSSISWKWTHSLLVDQTKIWWSNQLITKT